MDKATVEAYAYKTGLDLESAKKRLEDNYKKEVEQTDPKELSLKCIKAIRELSPKINGLVQREGDYSHGIKQNKLDIRKLQDSLSHLEGQNKALSADLFKLETSQQDLENRMDRLVEIVGKEINKKLPKPWYERLFDKIFNG